MTEVKKRKERKKKNTATENENENTTPIVDEKKDVTLIQNHHLGHQHHHHHHHHHRHHNNNILSSKHASLFNRSAEGSNALTTSTAAGLSTPNMNMGIADLQTRYAKVQEEQKARLWSRLENWNELSISPEDLLE